MINLSNLTNNTLVIFLLLLFPYKSKGQGDITLVDRISINNNKVKSVSIFKEFRDTSFLTKKFEFYENGELYKLKIYSMGILKEESIYTHTDTSMIIINGNKKTNYIKDSKGKTYLLSSSENDSIIIYARITYDDKKVVRKVLTYNHQNELLSEESFDYTKKEEITSEKSFLSTTPVYTVIKEIYNNKVKRIIFLYDYKPFSEKNFKNGRLINIKMLPEGDLKFIYLYDTKGNLVQENEINNKIEKCRYTYSYFPNGLKRTERMFLSSENNNTFITFNYVYEFFIK